MYHWALEPSDVNQVRARSPPIGLLARRARRARQPIQPRQTNQPRAPSSADLVG